MEITIIRKQDNIIHFLVEGVDVAFANAIRRTMLTRLPAMAIDEVLVLENTSVMYDEMLAHRMGLLPLVKLAPHQRLVIEAYARLGRGIENAKFQPVSTVSYKYVPIVEVNKEKCNQCGDCVNICPKNI